MSTDTKVSISGLYKIFGHDPKAALATLRDKGLGKPELLEQEGHVLGLQDINLDIPAREIQVIMGLSGSGKSTLIRHINRLIEPTDGHIIIDGEDVMQMDDKALRNLRRFKASMVFQKFGLLPHRTIGENVGYGLEIQGVDRADAAKRTTHWIERVGLSGYEDRYPAQLSGGMQQRVGLARALATDADILLMDEAFSALDPLIRADMQNILLDLQQELHKTIIFITHDLDEALRIGDRIAILRDGQIVQKGTPQQIIMQPADDYIRDFIRDINRGRVVQIGSIMGEVNGGAKAPPLPADCPLEQALPELNAAPDQTCAVTDDSGEVIGEVTLEDAIEALQLRSAA